MNDFWNFIKIIGYCICFSPLIIGLIAIATGNGSKGESKSWKQQRIEYENKSNELRREQLRQEQQRQEYHKFLEQYRSSIKQQKQITKPSYSSNTPDDAYNEGYDNGREQAEVTELMGIVTVVDMMIPMITMIIMTRGIVKDMKKDMMMDIVADILSTKKIVENEDDD